jgi:acyl-CoA thioesterase-1
MVTTARVYDSKIEVLNRVLLSLLMLAAISCGGSAPPEAPPGTDPASSSSLPPAPPPAPVRTAPRVVVLGDSLTAGLGLQPSEAYPALLEKKLREKGYDWEVVNAGVSGDTSGDGRQRLGWALEGDVRLLIVALGANDGLRGLPAGQMKENLQIIIDRARQRAIPVVLVGMEAPPNYGERYTREFRDAFVDLAQRNKVEFVPFLLEGVAGVGRLNQSDGVHPTSAGAQRIADHLWPSVEKMLKK